MEELLEKEKGINSKRASEKRPLLDLLIHDLTGPSSWFVSLPSHPNKIRRINCPACCGEARYIID
jgi:hypothetical protein